MLKNQTKKIKNRKVSKIIAGILSLLMFATSNGSFLVWGLSEGQLNFLGEPAVAQAKVIETADAITVDEIMQESQPKSHWWEFWKKEKTENQQTANGFSDLKTELVAREVLGDKTVDALSDDLKATKNNDDKDLEIKSKDDDSVDGIDKYIDLSNKQPKKKIGFFKKLWADFVGLFNKQLKTDILAGFGEDESDSDLEDDDYGDNLIFPFETKQVISIDDNIFLDVGKKYIRKKSKDDLNDNSDEDSHVIEDPDYYYEECNRFLDIFKSGCQSAKAYEHDTNVVIVDNKNKGINIVAGGDLKKRILNIVNNMRDEITSPAYFKRLLIQYDNDEEKAKAARQRRLDRLDNARISVVGYDSRELQNDINGVTTGAVTVGGHDIYLNKDDILNKTDKDCESSECGELGYELPHEAGHIIDMNGNRGWDFPEKTKILIKNSLKSEDEWKKVASEAYKKAGYDYITDLGEVRTRLWYLRHDLMKYLHKEYGDKITKDDVEKLIEIEKKSPGSLNGNTTQVINIIKTPRDAAKLLNEIADTKQYATGNQKELYAETRPYNPKTDGDVIDPITGDKVQLAKKKEGWLNGLIGKVFSPKESVAGEGDNTNLVIDQYGNVTDSKTGLFKGTAPEVWKKYSDNTRQEIQSDPTNTSQQSAKLRAVEEKKGWLSKLNPFSWFDGEKKSDERVNALDSFYTAGDENGKNETNDTAYNDLAKKYIQPDMKDGYGDEIVGLDDSTNKGNNQLSNNQQEVAFEKNPHEADLINSIEGSAEYNDLSKMPTTGTIRGASRIQIQQRLNEINRQINNIHGIRVDSNGNDSRETKRRLIQERERLQGLLNSGLVGENSDNGNQVPIIASPSDGYDENGNFRPTGLGGSAFNTSKKEKKAWLSSGWEKFKSWFGGNKNKQITEQKAKDYFGTDGEMIAGFGGDKNNDTAYNKAVTKYGKDDMKSGYGDEIAGIQEQIDKDNSFVTGADGNKVSFVDDPIIIDVDSTLADKTLRAGKDLTVYSTEEDIRDISSKNRDLLKDKYPIDKFNYVRLPKSRNNALIVEDKNNGQPVAMANGRKLFERDSEYLPFDGKMLERAKRKYGYVESKDRRTNPPQVVAVDKSSSQDVKSNKNTKFSEQKRWLKENYPLKNDGSVKYTKMPSGAVIVTKSGMPEAVLLQEDKTGYMLRSPILRSKDPEKVDRLFTKAIELGKYKLPSVLPSGRKEVVSSVKHKDNEVTHWEQRGNYLIGRNSKNVAILSQPLTKIPTKGSRIMNKVTTAGIFTGGPGVAIKLTSRLFGDNILHMFGSSKYEQVKSAYPIVTYSAPDDKKEYEPIRSLLQRAAQVNDNGGKVVSSRMLTDDGKSFKTQEEVLQSSQFRGKKQEKSPSGNVLIYGNDKQPIAYVKRNGEVIYSKGGEKFAQGNTKYSFFRTEKNESSIAQILSGIGDSVIKPVSNILQNNKRIDKNFSKKVGDYAVKEVKVRANNGSQQIIKVVVGNNNEVLGVFNKTGEIIQMKNMADKVGSMSENEINALIKTVGITAVAAGIGAPTLFAVGAYGLSQMPPKERAQTLDNLSKQVGNAGQQLVKTLNSAAEGINQAATKAQKVVNENIDAGQKSYDTYIPGRPEDVLPFSNEDYPKGRIYLDKKKSYSVSQDTNGKKTYEQCGTLGSIFSFFSGCKSGTELAKNNNDISTEKAPAWINPDTGRAYKDTNLKRAPVELADSKKNPVDTIVQVNQGVKSGINKGNDIKIEKNGENKDKVASRENDSVVTSEKKFTSKQYLLPDEGYEKDKKTGEYKKCFFGTWFCDSGEDLAEKDNNRVALKSDSRGTLTGYEDSDHGDGGSTEVDYKNDNVTTPRNESVINKDSTVISGTDASLVNIKPGERNQRIAIEGGDASGGGNVNKSSKINIKPLKVSEREEKSFWSRINPFKLLFGKKEKTAYEQAGEEFGSQYKVGTDAANSRDKQEESVKVNKVTEDEVIESIAYADKDGNIRWINSSVVNEIGDKFKDNNGREYTKVTPDNPSNYFSEVSDEVKLADDGDVNSDMISGLANDSSVLPVGQIDSGVLQSAGQEAVQSGQVDVQQSQSQVQSQVPNNFNLDQFLDSGLVNGLARGSKEVLGMLSNGTLTADQGTRILAENVIQSTGQEAARQLFGDPGNDGEKHLTSLQSGLADLATGVISAVSLGDTDRLVESAGGLALNAAWDTLAENNLISTDVHDSLNGYIGNAMEHTAATLVSTGDIGETVKVFATDVSSGYLTEVINNNASLWGEGSMPIGQTGVVTTGLSSFGSSVIGQLINNGSIDLERTAIDVGQGVITTEITNAVVSQYLATQAVQNAINQTLIDTVGLDAVNNIAISGSIDQALTNEAILEAAGSQTAAQAATAIVPFVSMLMAIGMDLVQTGTVHAETVGVATVAAAGATVGGEIYGPIGAVIGGALGAIAGAFGIGTGGPSERMLKEWQRTTEEAVAPNLLNNNIAPNDMRRINQALANNDIGAVDRIVNNSLKNTPLGQIAGMAGLEGIFDIAERMVQNEFTRAMNVRALPGVLEANTVDYLPGNNVVNDYIHLSNKLSDCYRRHDQDCVTDVSKQLHKAKGTVMSYVTNNFNDKIREIDREILKLQEELNRVTDQKRRLELQSRVSSLSSQRRVINNAREQFIKSQAHSCGGGTSWDFNARACISDQQACLNRGGYIWRGGRCVLNNTAKKEAECLKKGAGWDWTGYSCEWDDPEGGDGDSD